MHACQLQERWSGNTGVTQPYSYNVWIQSICSSEKLLINHTINKSRLENIELAMILKNCANLQDTENSINVRKIYFTPDLTPGEIRSYTYVAA